MRRPSGGALVPSSKTASECVREKGFVVDPRQTSHLSHFNTLPWLQNHHLRAFAFGEPGKLFRVSEEGWKSAVVNRHNGFRVQEFDCFGCVLWSHDEVFADRQKCQIDSDIVSDQFQV